MFHLLFLTNIPLPRINLSINKKLKQYKKMFSEFCPISVTISHITSRVRYPSAAHSDPYCLLCFQPKPLRDSSTQVKSSLLMNPTSDYELG